MTERKHSKGVVAAAEDKAVLQAVAEFRASSDLPSTARRRFNETLANLIESHTHAGEMEGLLRRKPAERPPAEPTWGLRAIDRVLGRGDIIPDPHSQVFRMDAARIIEAEAPLRECEEALERLVPLLREDTAINRARLSGRDWREQISMAESALKKLRGQP